MTKRHDAAFIGALAFAFAPYRLAQIPHIQVLSSFWTPFCLAALHRFTDDRRARWAVFAAVAWLMQALSSGYYLFFLSVLLIVWVLWFAIGRWSLRQVVIAATAFAVAVVLLLPLLLGYEAILRDTYGLLRSYGEIRFFSADVASLLYASDELLAWGWVHVIERPETTLFPGITIPLLTVLAVVRGRSRAAPERDTPSLHALRIFLTVLLIVLLVAASVPLVHGAWHLTVGGVRLLSIARADKPFTLASIAALVLVLLAPRMRGAVRSRSALVFYLLAAFAMWVLALGPEPTALGQRVIYQAPYRWLMRLPGFDGLRVPARFWMMSLACLSVVAALAVDRITGRSRRLVIVAAAAGLLIDGWPRTFKVLPAPELRPSPPGVVARLDLPIAWESDAQALYRQTFDRVTLYNGFSGYAAPHYYALGMMIEARDPRILQILAAPGPIGVVVDHAGDPDESLRKFVLAYPGARRDRNEATWSSYRLPQSTEVPTIPDRSGTLVPIKSVTTFPSPQDAERALDGNLLTCWSGSVQRESAEATIELPEATYVGQVVTDLGGFITDFPRRLQIDVSADGRSWETAWIGDTALHAYYGAVRHPREVPLVFALNRDHVRFIRLRQTRVDTGGWTIAELHVRR
jgi:hypothetical protein